MKVKKFIKKYIQPSARRINIYSETGDKLLDSRLIKDYSSSKYNNYHIACVDAHGFMFKNKIATVINLYVYKKKKK